MGWSPLSTETWNTSQYSARITSPKGVVLHHGATTSADAIISMEVTGSRQVSSHQVVKDKRNAGIVQEQFRAWSLSDAYWDSWAFTVECANESTNGWTISDESHETLAQLVADWAIRYGFWPHREGASNTWTVYGHREIYSIFGASYATACPGGMNLDFVAKRAQQIINGEEKEEVEMEVYGYIMDQGMAPADPRYGSTAVLDLRAGTLTDTSKGLTSRAQFDKLMNAPIALGLGKVLNVDINQWNYLHERSWTQAGTGGGGTAPSPEQVAIAVDTKLAPRFEAIPTKEENGNAARTAIVK